MHLFLSGFYFFLALTDCATVLVFVVACRERKQAPCEYGPCHLLKMVEEGAIIELDPETEEYHRVDVDFKASLNNQIECYTTARIAQGTV